MPILTKYEDVRAVLVDDIGMPGGMTYAASTEPVVGRTFISMDGSEHDTYRNLATPAFRSRSVSEFVSADLIPLANELVDGFADRGEADLVQEFSSVLPFLVISQMLGLPHGQVTQQRQWARALLSYPATPDAALQASAELTAFLEPIVDERHAHPTDDVLSQLLTGRHGGRGLSRADVLAHVRLLYAVGATTTSDALANLLWTVLGDPKLRALAKQAPLRPRLVEETLRVQTPVPMVPRILPRGGTAAGVQLGPGSVVLVAFAAANRDPECFPDPHTFDPDRPGVPILSFGYGRKYCPGNQLARQQLTAALDVLLTRLPELEVVIAQPPLGAVLRAAPQVVAKWSVPALR